MNCRNKHLLARPIKYSNVSSSKRNILVAVEFKEQAEYRSKKNLLVAVEFFLKNNREFCFSKKHICFMIYFRDHCCLLQRSYVLLPKEALQVYGDAPGG
jgi:hypothetical protein